MLNIDEILSKICVSRPYFNFDYIEKTGETLIAPIKIEQKHQEGTPLCLGEAMRHMAILGSCAYAIKQPEKQYYLATSASGFTNKAEQVGELEAVAKVLSVNNNDLLCEVLLWNQNAEIVHKTKINYKIFKKSVFERLFKNSRQSYKSNEDAYKTNLENEVVMYGGNCIEAQIDKIEPDRCSGHFDNYPVVPIAYLCHHLAQMCCMIEKNLIFKSFEATFDCVATIDKPIKLMVGKQGNQFTCESEQDNKTINKLKLYV